MITVTNQTDGVGNPFAEQIIRALNQSAIVAVTDLHGTIVYVNDQFCAISQYSREELLGHDHRVINSGHHPTDFFRQMYQTITHGDVWHGEVCNRAKDGSLYWVKTTIVPFIGENGKPDVYVAIREDITALKLSKIRIERLSKIYHALSEVNQAIVRMENESSLFPLVCRMTVDFGDMALAWIGQPNETGERLQPVICYGNRQDYLEGIVISLNADSPESRGPASTAFRKKQTVIVNHFDSDALMPLWQGRANRFGFKSCAFFPIWRNARSFAVLSVYHQEANAFDQEIIDVLEEMTRDISFALDNFDRNREAEAAHEQALHANEQLQTLIEAIPDAVFLKDGEGRWQVINEPAKQLFQLHALPWQGKTEMELADLRPVFRQALEGCLASDEMAWQAGQLLVGEESMVGEEGQCTIVEARKVPMFDKDGRRKGLAVIGRDITARKQVDDALKASEMKLRTLYESTSDAVMLLNDKRFLDCNRATLALFGCISNEEFCSKHPADLSPTVQPCGIDSRTLADQHIANAIQNGSNHFEWMHKRIDTNQPFYADVLLNVMNLNGETFLQAVVRDITARKALEARNERLTKLYKALGEVNQAIVRMDDESSLFPLVCRMAVDFGGMKMAWIGRLNEVNGLIEPVVNYGESEHLNSLVISSNEGLTEEYGRIKVAFHENRSMVTNDLKNSGIEESRREWALRYGFGSNGVFPIPRAGKPFAILFVCHAYPGAFDAEMIGLLDEISGVISFALDNFDRETERKRIEQDLRISATAFETQEGIMITDQNNRILRVNRAFTNLTGYSAIEAIGQTPAMLKSERQDAAFYRGLWETLLRDKYWQGELWNRRKNGEYYPEWLTITAVTNADGQITNYVGAFSDISVRKQADDKIHQLAFHDPLTNLSNRSLLRDRLLQAMASSARSQQEGALLFIDLDNFKTLNDTRGHDVGDMLLREVAKRLQNCVRDIDTVARLGGDEFIVMLEDLSEDERHAATVARDVGEKILIAISQPFNLQGIEYHGSSSIGITLFCGEEIGMYDLLKYADTAMYQAKSAGRNTLRFFDTSTQEKLEMRAALVDDLRQALPLGQLELYYQIQVDGQGVVGAEALLRWQHPKRGMVSPMEFIPLAEETGLIVSIGAWVLKTACAQLKAWQTDPLTRYLQLAVNVSARQFRELDFVEQVLDILKEAGLNPHNLGLEFELTESLVLHDIDDSIRKMQLLRTAGICFSLDDFGTGQSSLSYLKLLPLNQIKIDQSFVRDVATDQNDAVIVRTIIGMADNLGLHVIAEGVETEQQRDFLERNGCYAHQGYLFGRPVPIEEFQKSLVLRVQSQSSARTPHVPISEQNFPD
ncbi:MAG: EAL domain-containing protein [Ferrovum sp.]|nr:EAL domain-containing protein [Ferrovum sp.]NDU87662.1 EAL domain-containing protein [Ferrovum sp.]